MFISCFLCGLCGLYWLWSCAKDYEMTLKKGEKKNVCSLVLCSLSFFAVPPGISLSFSDGDVTGKPDDLRSISLV